jgi:methyltransferase (TIGR00027 family)
MPHMSPGAARISGTARNMAAFRALESVKPARERLFFDPYAKRFLPPAQRFLAACSSLTPLRRLIERYADRRAPGARTSGIARTRLIDDWLGREVERGVRQIVVLGSGFDCRALRLPGLADIPLFEIDRPALVGYKSRLLEREYRARRNIKPVRGDFLIGDLAERLSAAGYVSGLKTFFLWEGVTNYLTAESVAAVFDWVARNASPHSKIAFTYVHADAVAGRFQAPGLPALLEALRRRGEPWTFGFDPAALPGYLATHGIRLLADLGAAQYRRRYWQAMPEQGIGYEFYRAALAEVAPRAAR